MLLYRPYIYISICVYKEELVYVVQLTSDEASAGCRNLTCCVTSAVFTALFTTQVEKHHELTRGAVFTVEL